MDKYEALEDRVLISEIKQTEKDKTAAGIVMVAERPERLGKVVSVGEGRYAYDNGQFIPTILKKGDMVLFITSAGLTLNLDMDGSGIKQDYVLMREGDCIMKIN